MAAAAALACGAAAAPAPAASSPCPDDAAERCGVLTVPLDRTGATAGSLALRYRLQPATGTRRGVLLFLAGGPGEAAVGDGSLLDFVTDLAPRWDVVVMDTRGTGAGALRCDALGRPTPADLTAGPARLTVLAAACAERLGPARAFYTSLDTAADIEDLRREVGADRLAVAGVSYGTLVAQVYARLFPASVDRLVLDSVVDDRTVDGSGLDRLAASRRVLRELCAGGACRGVTGDALADAGRLDRLLARRALRGEVTLPSGRRRALRLGGPSLPQPVLAALLAGDLSPGARAAFPGAVRAALSGDADPLLRMVSTGETAVPPDPRRLSIALFAATVCRDTRLPWAPGTPLEARPAAVDARAAAIPPAAYVPWSRATAAAGETLSLCLRWPEDPVALPDAPLPDVPALVLAGRQDVRTPLEQAQEVAGRLPRASLVSVPGAGHAVIVRSECARDAVRAFLAGRGAPRRCDAAPTPSVAPVPARRFADLRPLPGLPPRVGRAARGVLTTLGGLRATTAAFAVPAGRGARVAGLRGGLVRVSEGRLAFARFSEVPGVTLSGVVTGRGGTLRVGGLVPGRLGLEDGVLEGTLGGVPVRLPFSAGSG